MNNGQPKNPLHGVTLEAILNSLVEKHGWEDLAQRVRINCFKNDPSVTSSLKFLRKTQWARKQVEALYISGLTKNSPWSEAMANFQASNRGDDPERDPQP
ncbi:VF530 family DNA-binding protein [Luminiphilus sp. nBUS_07]|uniref:VF530 family protein n=1 Tax=Luminiphilus sp. nBUS_07 TaxID=3395314 RepID=UPI003EB8A024